MPHLTQKSVFLKTVFFLPVTLSRAHSVALCASFVKKSVQSSQRFSRNSIIVCLYFGPLVSGESVVADVTRKYHLRIHTPRNSMWVRQQAGRPNYKNIINNKEGRKVSKKLKTDFILEKNRCLGLAR